MRRIGAGRERRSALRAPAAEGKKRFRAPPASIAANGIIQASRLKPSVVGAERIFSPYLVRNHAIICGTAHAAGDHARRFESRTGTANSHCGWLQFATVRPHPHWQVRPSLTSWTRRSRGATDGSAGAIAEASVNSASDRERQSQESARQRSVTTGNGLRAEIERRRCTHGRSDGGAFAYVRPHHDHGAERHD